MSERQHKHTRYAELQGVISDQERRLLEQEETIRELELRLSTNVAATNSERTRHFEQTRAITGAPFICKVHGAFPPVCPRCEGAK